MSANEWKWRRTNAPVASSRTDDIWFVDEITGWAVNSNGQILKTENGGDNWEEQLQAPVYWRCIAFANENVGWAGSLTAENRLYHTENGGKTWTRISTIPEIPAKICGISVIDEDTVVCSGTNEPGDTAAIAISQDRGRTWVIRDMSDYATLLVDNLFFDALNGFVVGGLANPDVQNPKREDVFPVILYTQDGGATWENRLQNIQVDLRKGEWGWKIQFLDPSIGFVSFEAFDWGAIAKTRDGGITWERMVVNDPQANANLEGIGFIDEYSGWVGGWGDRQFERGATSSTYDGGNYWQDANEVGRFINRFRFVGSPLKVAYASGDTVYKYSTDPVLPSLTDEELHLLQDNFPKEISEKLILPINIPQGTHRIRVDAWDRFGSYVWAIHDDFGPEPGNSEICWDFRVWRGRLLAPGIFIVRVTADSLAESVLVEYLGGDLNGDVDGGDLEPTFNNVIAILNESVGGDGSPVGAHGAFWRNRTRDELVEMSPIFGVDLITVGDGANSGLVKSLRGQAPFGSDIGTEGGLYRRMPAGRSPIPDSKIAVIESWIDNGAPE